MSGFTPGQEARVREIVAEALEAHEREIAAAISKQRAGFAKVWAEARLATAEFNQAVRQASREYPQGGL